MALCIWKFWFLQSWGIIYFEKHHLTLWCLLLKNWDEVFWDKTPEPDATSIFFVLLQESEVLSLISLSAANYSPHGVTPHQFLLGSCQMGLQMQNVRICPSLSKLCIIKVTGKLQICDFLDACLERKPCASVFSSTQDSGGFLALRQAKGLKPWTEVGSDIWMANDTAARPSINYPIDNSGAFWPDYIISRI